MKLLFKVLLLLILGACLPESVFAQENSLPKDPDPKKVSDIAKWQERVWTSIDGRKVTARAVSKNEENVSLRMKDGKRVSVALNKLSQDDTAWLAEWKNPDIKVVSSMKPRGYGKKEQRLLNFKSTKSSIEIWESQIPNLLSAFKEFFELASKPMGDIKNYEKIIFKGDQFASTKENLLIFKVVDGKPVCSGDCINGTITLDQLISYQDFLETFSVSDWDREQELIKRRFE